MKRFKDFNIGTKLVFVITIIMVVALAATGCVSYLTASDGLKQSVCSNLQTIATDTAKQYDVELDLLYSQIEGIAFRDKTKTMDWAQQKPALQNEVERLKFIKMGISDLNGTVTYTDETKGTVSDKDYFKKALAGKNGLSEPVYNEKTQKLEIYTATPIMVNDKISQVLVTVFDYDRFYNIIKDIKVGKTGYVYLVNKDGAVIVHPKQESVKSKENAFNEVKNNPKLSGLVSQLKKVINGETGYGEYIYDGKTKFMGYAPLSNEKWFVAVSAPKDELFTSITQLSMQIIPMIIIFIVLSIIALILLSRYLITRPVRKLVKSANRLALGDVNITMQAKSKDEIGILTEALSEIVDTIKDKSDNMKKLAEGNFEFNIVSKSQDDILAASIKQVKDALKELINDANMLADAAVNGDLTVRGNIDNFEGGYAEVIDGMNRTMEAVMKPIKEASEVLQIIAKGDLTVTMNGEYKGDYSKIKDNLNYTIATFNSILHDIEEAAVQVAAGSKQVSDSAQSLSQGSTEQASSVEELTASMEQIAVQTKQNTENANKANELALNVKNDAVNGNNQMNEMLASMDQINESSANISKIIKVIDDIAFQTNILALNAAVEAARAGQHGKGFAVVAEEVRNLAARSANAAKETTALIEGSIKKVENGTKIAKDTSAALDKIVDGITRASTLVGEIASASNEQESGIQQVNKGILQVSDVTQTNSATAEESAAASEELSGQADTLRSMIEKFKLAKKDTDKYSDIKIDLKMLDKVKEKSTERSAGKNKLIGDSEFGKY